MLSPVALVAQGESASAAVARAASLMSLGAMAATTPAGRARLPSAEVLARRPPSRRSGSSRARAPGPPSSSGAKTANHAKSERRCAESAHALSSACDATCSAFSLETAPAESRRGSSEVLRPPSSTSASPGAPERRSFSAAAAPPSDSASPAMKTASQASRASQRATSAARASAPALS